MQTKIKEELSKAPYAGIFIAYMIPQFKTLKKQNLKFWTISISNIYFLEMILMKDTQEKLFKTFINDFPITSFQEKPDKKPLQKTN